MALNPHLGEFASLSLSEPPVWQVQDTGTSVDIQTGDGTPSIRFHPDGTVSIPQGLDAGEVTGAIDADTLDGLDSTAFVHTTDAIDADTLDGLDSTAFVHTTDAIDADTLDGIDSTAFWQKAEFDPAEYAALAAAETITGNWTHTGTLTADGTLRVPRVTSDPASPQTGTLWYNETDDVFRFRLASTTAQVPADGGTGGGGGGTTTLLEGFEDGDMAGWEGLTGGYSVVTSPALEGTYTLEAATNFNQIANANIATPRDGTYSCLVRAASDGGRPGMLTNVQSVPTGLFDNCYWVSINTVENRLYLTKRSGGTGTDLEMQTGVAVDPNVTYRLKLLLPTTSSIQARVEQPDGTLIAETASYSDATHTGGSLGIYPGGSGTQYYDAFRKE